MRGCQVAYYLVHSMIASGRQFREVDQQLAFSFARAAERAGVRRIIYLGGLGEEGPSLSKHRTSRLEVGNALASTSVQFTSLRAAMIIGSGSASFEILRYLVERLPFIFTPRWVYTESQPIAVRNVLEYLIQCLEKEETAGRSFDIGGPDILTYEQIMRIMAEERGLPRRWIIPIPVLTPYVSSLWISLITPVSASIARPLAEGLRNRVVCRNDDAIKMMPQPLLDIREAIRRSLTRLESNRVETAWFDAGVLPGDPDWAGGTTFTDRRETSIRATAKTIFEAICRLGGGHGYYSVRFLWELRGFMDRLVGGPGLRRGRRNLSTVSYGDALDFWRVTAVDPDRRLELHAEMKLPGVAFLTFEIQTIVDSNDAPRCRLVQTAQFKPRGLFALLYWYSILPLHHLVFNGMLTGIRHAAQNRTRKMHG